MSTRSYICRENADGTYTGIYCHHDGYLDYNGAMLLKHYADREKVDKLFSLGCLSSLCPNLDPDPNKPHSFDYDKRQDGVCVFYGRDRGENDQEAFPVELNKLYENCGIEYCYVFTRDGKWKYFRPENSAVILRDVETDLNVELHGRNAETFDDGDSCVPGDILDTTDWDAVIFNNMISA